MYKKRINSLRETFAGKNLDGFFVANRENQMYLTGFRGEDSYLFLTLNKIYLFVDGRFTTQAQDECFESVEVVEYKPPFYSFLRNYMDSEKIHWLGIEKHRLSLNDYINLKNELGATNIVLTSDFVEEFRVVKDEEEVEVLKVAQEIADKSFLEVLPFIKSGVKEKDVALELEYRMKKNGGEKPSFDTIVASGRRGALPHGVASDKTIKEGEFIVVDFGTFYSGYASDCTRTIVLGNVDEKEREIYNIVLEAQKLALSNVKAGISVKELDKIARDYIESKGYKKEFNHSLGHGVGLEIHELPYSRSETVLKENMVITIEPGIYIPEDFGVRIEDSVVVKTDGCINLTTLPKDLKPL